MRFVLMLLLALVIPINAAYSAATVVCDGVDDHAQHGQHFGHHQHDHDGVGDADPAQTSGGDPHHSHAHPVFSFIVPAPIVVHFNPEPAIAAFPPQRRLTSVTPVRLDRPPRFVLVA
ncbi:MAG: hypothetical protein HYZ17_00480 [Betaproteobacteria bacterium]|nr:hypothetical protein [Betaproteobacteria bacterium]